MPTRKQVEKVLQTIPDPEINVSVWDLGLIYDVTVEKEGTVCIVMTLTTMGCPLFNLIADSIREKVQALNGVKKVEIQLTFEPPWSVDKMSPQAKEQLGFG
jgi:metal-sulfur cluster biosynthetic enzyme